jgi:phage major head subunit gpT-like protein
MFTNFSTIFQTALNEPGYPSVVEQICTVYPSSTLTEEFDFTYFLGGMKKWVGTRQLEKWAAETMRVTNMHYENSVEISRDDFEDDRLGGFALGLRQMATDARQHRDEELALFLNAHIAGTATADYPVGFDGLTLFKATHNWGAGSNYTTDQSNILTGGNAGKLDLTYGRATITAALAAAGGYRKPNGVRMQFRPTHLVCASNTVLTAREILHDAGFQLGATTTTDLVRGTLNPLYNPGIKVLELPGLTAGYWALLDCSGAVKPIIFQLRQEIEFHQAASQAVEQGDTQFLTNQLMYGVDARYAFGAGPWWKGIAGDAT